jgi:hypothetical protein
MEGKRRIFNDWEGRAALAEGSAKGRKSGCVRLCRVWRSRPWAMALKQCVNCADSPIITNLVSINAAAIAGINRMFSPLLDCIDP